MSYLYGRSGVIGSWRRCSRKVPVAYANSSERNAEDPKNNLSKIHAIKFHANVVQLRTYKTYPGIPAGQCSIPIGNGRGAMFPLTPAATETSGGADPENAAALDAKPNYIHNEYHSNYY